MTQPIGKFSGAPVEPKHSDTTKLEPIFSTRRFDLCLDACGQPIVRPRAPALTPGERRWRDLEQATGLRAARLADDQVALAGKPRIFGVAHLEIGFIAEEAA